MTASGSAKRRAVLFSHPDFNCRLRNHTGSTRRLAGSPQRTYRR